MTAAVPPPTPMQQQELAEARAKFAAVSRAAVVGTVDAYALSIMAVLSLLGLIITPRAIGVTVVLAVVAVVEFVQLKRLHKLSPAAPLLLGVNQLVLSTLMVGYAIYRYIEPSEVPPRLMSWWSSYNPDDIEVLHRWMMLLIYVIMIGIGIFMQGSLAVFYLTRQGPMRELLATTPAWIVESQRRQPTL